eukprot:g1120.t1
MALPPLPILILLLAATAPAATSLAAPGDRKVMFWLFTQYLNDTELDLKVASLAADRAKGVLTHVSPTTHTLGTQGNLLELRSNANATWTSGPLFAKLRAAGLRVQPTLFNNEAGQASLPPKLRTLFAAPQTFIAAAVKLCVDHDLDGWNLDFETGKNTVTPPDAAALADFVGKLGTALHARGKVLSIDVVAHETYDTLWNHSLLNSTSGLDVAANMGSYTPDFAQFVESTGDMVEYYYPTTEKIGVGLCPVCRGSHPPLTAAEIEARFQVIQELGAGEVDVWADAVPEAWHPHFQAYLNGADMRASTSTSSASNTSSATPPPFAFDTPTFKVGRTFAQVSNGTLRDPTTAVFDPVTESWHVLCTHIPHGTAGYSGTIWHFSLRSKDLFDRSVPWRDEGQALGTSGSNFTFDASGVFTPALLRSCPSPGSSRDSSSSSSSSNSGNNNNNNNNNNNCTWLLFFGGVQNQSSAHTEDIGVAISTAGPWGPWSRHHGNPVFKRDDPNSKWCGGGGGGGGEAARVDEIKPTMLGGQRYLLVKSVCSNFSALPIVYRPTAPDTWAPPYEPVGNGPLFRADDTCARRGFEEPTVFVGPRDGNLHFLGHNHGNCGQTGRYAHFVRQSPALFPASAWHAAPLFGAGSTFMEPVPIPAAGDGVFGGAIYEHTWIDFLVGPDKTRGLFFSNVTWTKSTITNNNNNNNNTAAAAALAQAQAQAQAPRDADADLI